MLALALGAGTVTRMPGFMASVISRRMVRRSGSRAAD
jgi:hypothetical protein